MTATSRRIRFPMKTALALAASVILSGLVISPAAAGTRVNEANYRMSRSSLFNLCTTRNADIFCTTSNSHCTCDDGKYIWTYYRDRPNRNPNHVTRAPSSRRSIVSAFGGEGSGVGGVGGGSSSSSGRGGKP